MNFYAAGAREGLEKGDGREVKGNARAGQKFKAVGGDVSSG